MRGRIGGEGQERRALRADHEDHALSVLLLPHVEELERGQADVPARRIREEEAVAADPAQNREVPVAPGLDEDDDGGTITIDTEDGLIPIAYDGDTTFVLRGTPFLKEDMEAKVVYLETDDDTLAKRVTASMAD